MINLPASHQVDVVYRMALTTGRFPVPADKMGRAELHSRPGDTVRALATRSSSRPD